MSERLEDLKEKHRKCCLNRGISIFSIKDKDIEWFIKQATQNVERTKQLTALNYLLQSIIPPKRMSEFVGKDVIDVATIILKEQYGFIKEENESQ